MIIAAHAGTGKTEFAKRIGDSKDLLCVPYKYDIPDGYVVRKEDESIKASLPYELNLEWPNNYAKEVINAGNIYRYVLIPPISPVLAVLRRENIPYILCYPGDECKDEYERRYRERGNPEEFMDVFIKRWSIFLRQMEKEEAEYRIVMRPGQYLTDLLPTFEKIIERAGK